MIKLTLDSKITCYDFGVRGERVCRRLGVLTVGELIQKTEDDLAGTKGCGSTTLRDMKLILQASGFSLACSPSLMIKEIEVGCVVQLKSGGPNLTVDWVGKDELEGDSAFCSWFAGTDLKREPVLLSSLVRVA